MNTAPTTLTRSQETIRADFREKGYALFPGVISRERALEIREFLLREFAREFPGENYGEADIIFDHLRKFPNLLDTVTNPRLVEALKIILGEQIILMPPASCLRNSFWNLHTDVTTMTSQGCLVAQRPDFTGVAVAIYLQDNDEQGGGMFVVPGTHKLEEDPLVEQKLRLKGIGVPITHRLMRRLTGNRFPRYEDFSAYEKGGIDIPSKMGDALIMDMRLLHRGSQPGPGVKRDRTKLGIFTTVTAPGEGDYIDYWMEYLHSDHDHPFHYLKEGRNIDSLREAAIEAGFLTAL